MALRVLGRLLCRDADEAEGVRQALPEHIRLSLEEPGCRSFDISPHPEDPVIFVVDECFEDEAAFEAHQLRTEHSDWARQTAGIPREFEARA